jgi:hypothetical protein
VTPVRNIPELIKIEKIEKKLKKKIEKKLKKIKEMTYFRQKKNNRKNKDIRMIINRI